MKIAIKNTIKHFCLISPILLAVTFCITGCDTSKTLWAKFWFSGGTAPKPAPDPLIGWHSLGFDPNSVNKEIQDDYQDYIQQQNMKGYAGPIQFFEDGTGRHAVGFEAFEHNRNASWHYALIYDEKNERVKVVKYGYRWYQS